MSLRSSVLSCALHRCGRRLRAQRPLVRHPRNGLRTDRRGRQASSPLRAALAARRRDRGNQPSIGGAARSAERRADRGADRRAQSRAAGRATKGEQNPRTKTERLRAARTASSSFRVGRRGHSRLGRARRATNERYVRINRSRKPPRAADADLMAYQQNVIAQDNAASSSIATAPSARGPEYRAKAEQLHAERNRSFAASDAAGRRLALGDQDAPLQSRLRSGRAQTGATAARRDRRQRGCAAGAQRDVDAATLRSYRQQLDRQTGDAIRSQVGAIQAQTRGKLEERRNEVGTQLRSLGPPVAADEHSARRAGAHRADPSTVCRTVPSRRRENDRGVQRDEKRSRPAVCGAAWGRRRGDRSRCQGTRNAAEAARRALWADRRAGGT